VKDHHKREMSLSLRGKPFEFKGKTLLKKGLPLKNPFPKTLTSKKYE